MPSKDSFPLPDQLALGPNNTEAETAISKYFEYFRILGRPGIHVVERCRHPLLLRFFCEANQDRDVSEIKNIRLKDLFDLYWERKLKSIAERGIRDGSKGLTEAGFQDETGTYLMSLAGFMLDNNVRSVPLTLLRQVISSNENPYELHSVYGRIRDEYLILEEKYTHGGTGNTRQVSFVYEEFMEYVMARSLMARWGGRCASAEFMNSEIDLLAQKYTTFAQVAGVMVYLSLMLRTEYNFALWSTLAKRGGQWHRTIFETVQKLSEDQLDPDVIDVLIEIASAGGDKGIQVEAIALLSQDSVSDVGAGSIVSFLARLVNHPNEYTACRAIKALGDIAQGNEAIVGEVLFRALESKRPRVSTSAVGSLSQLVHIEPERVAKALRSRQPHVRHGAAKLIENLHLSPLVGN